MTYNVFSGTLNPTHFTSLHVVEWDAKLNSVNQLKNAHKWFCLFVYMHMFLYVCARPCISSCELCQN